MGEDQLQGDTSLASLETLMQYQLFPTFVAVCILRWLGGIAGKR